MEPRRLLLLTLAIVFSSFVLRANKPKTTVYLLPGQGADYRLFNNLEIDPSFEVRCIDYETPDKGTSMEEYACLLAKQIDTSGKFILIGTSLGGMLATEMGEFLHPEKIIIIASAKCSNELPMRYKFQKKIPLYKMVPPRMAKMGAKILQPIVEPDRNKEKETFKRMLEDKDPDFLRRTIEMILTWDRIECRNDIIHIHGDKDRTIPIRNVQYDYLVEKGSHMMTLTRGKEISSLINEILREE